MQESCFTKLFTQWWKIDTAECFVGRNGQFERSTLQVVDEDLKIVRQNVSVFWRGSEEIFRMFHDELIERSR